LHDDVGLKDLLRRFEQHRNAVSTTEQGGKNAT